MSATTPPPAATPDDSKNKTPDDDSLGYDAYAKTLWARIEQALNRDAITGKLGDDPLVVGIFGEWGAGKSFLLNAIRNLSNARLAEQKARRESDPGDMLTIPVWFQAWKYEHEEYLHVPLLLHVMNALKDALREPPSIATKTVDIASNAVDVVEKIAKPTGKLLKAADTAFPIVQKILGSVSLFGFQLNIPDELGDWLETAAGAAEGDADDKNDYAADQKKKAEKERKNAKSHVTTATRDGLYFYRIHELLAALTRPGKYEGRKDLFGSAQLTKETRINFVVFVDDLDRCLPEKAVAVLELIKTVFNVESFAFVRALDDEVIERGIGYRYKDYAFGNKKAEMPITGFEYLEKIVHLPFRLPALTREDALRYMRRKEQNLLESLSPPSGSPYVPTAWFSDAVNVHSSGRTEIESGAVESSADSAHIGPQAWPDGLDTARIEIRLANFVLSTFNQYVPRKLDRVVELFHQHARIAAERGRPLGTTLGGDADPRVVLSFVLLQLFQPDLFRCLRRTGNGFDVLRGGFHDGTLSPEISDHDLWNWVCYAGQKHPINVAEAQSAGRRPPVTLEDTLSRISELTDDRRFPAQRVRLPIVERLLEHRAAYRHAFDPLRLFGELNNSFTVIPLQRPNTSSYYSLLTVERNDGSESYTPALIRVPLMRRPKRTEQATETLAASETDGASVSVSGHVPSIVVHVNLPTSTINGVYSALISAEESDQVDAVNRASLQTGQVIASASAAQLHSLVNAWLQEYQSKSGTNRNAKHQLLRGLQYVAPHLASDDAKSFWELVRDSVTLPTIPDHLVEEPKIAALYADVGSALGQDKRFDEKRPYLLKKRFANHNEKDEPLPGFVRIPDGAFTFGHRDESSNPRRKSFSIDEPFYISRTLTTVAQYERFVNAGGYQFGQFIWSEQGLDWRGGRFDSKVTDKAYKDYLAQREPESRKQPWEWDAQLTHASRPVTGISWFEARAYARWLNAQMRDALKGSGLDTYEVMLPTEPQWERAALASSLTTAHAGLWPWGDEGPTAGQRANIESSGIGHTSAVGVFAPNAIGLFDMAGNVWEWMDNLYLPGENETFSRVDRDATRLSGQDLDTSDRPALRGCSWVRSAQDARCASRLRSPPVACGDEVGFRVVLSLAKSEA